jgi:uncharacterized membrane protein
MPYCTQCGNQVSDQDVFCAKCGQRQTGAAAGATTASPRDFLDGVSPQTASICCYIPYLGWIAAIIALAAPKFQHDRVVRFHAFQGLYLFVVWLLVDWVVSPLFGFVPTPYPSQIVRGVLKLAVVLSWIFMLVKTSQNEMYRLPIIGELAERSMSEQR